MPENSFPVGAASNGRLFCVQRQTNGAKNVTQNRVALKKQGGLKGGATLYATLPPDLVPLRLEAKQGSTG